MKIIFSILLTTVLLTFSSVNLYSQTSKSEKVKECLLELFELSQKDDFKSACKYIVYRGEDITRQWNDYLNENNSDELKYAREICKEIKSYLLECPDYEFKKFTTETESEGEWCVWKVEFYSSGQTKTKYFAFLKIKGKYCLGDID